MTASRTDRNVAKGSPSLSVASYTHLTTTDTSSDEDRKEGVL